MKNLATVLIVCVLGSLVACQMATNTKEPGESGFTVTFDSNGGSTVAPITGVSSGAKVTAPTPPTKAGSTFLGWFRDTGLTQAWDFAAATVTANVTLYAKWLAGGYTLSVTSPDANTLYGFSNGTTGEDNTPYFNPITLGFTTNAASVKYKLNSGTWQTASSGQNLVDQVVAGPNTVQVQAYDAGGQAIASTLTSVSFFQFTPGTYVSKADYLAARPSDQKFSANWSEAGEIVLDGFSSGAPEVHPSANDATYHVVGGKLAIQGTGNTAENAPSPAFVGIGITTATSPDLTNLFAMRGIAALPTGGADENVTTYLGIASQFGESGYANLHAYLSAVPGTAGQYYFGLVETGSSASLAPTGYALRGTQSQVSLGASPWTTGSSLLPDRYALLFGRVGTVYHAILIDSSSQTASVPPSIVAQTSVDVSALTAAPTAYFQYSLMDINPTSDDTLTSGAVGGVF